MLEDGTTKELQPGRGLREGAAGFFAERNDLAKMESDRKWKDLSISADIEQVTEEAGQVRRAAERIRQVGPESTYEGPPVDLMVTLKIKEQGSKAARRSRGGYRRPAGPRSGPLGTERRGQAVPAARQCGRRADPRIFLTMKKTQNAP